MASPSERESISLLQQLPLDILFEVSSAPSSFAAGLTTTLSSPFAHMTSQILGYLDLFSIFYLSRTSKAFRNTLMSRSTRGLWKKSYAATAHELPPIPEDVSIPQFVSFIVDNVCDVRRALRLSISLLC